MNQESDSKNYMCGQVTVSLSRTDLDPVLVGKEASECYQPIQHHPDFILTYTDAILNKVCLWSQPIHSILNKVCLWSQLIQLYPEFIPHYPQSDHTIPSLTGPSKVWSTGFLS